MSTDRTFPHQRRPPDAEEALSSMLWTPYERSWTDSSSDEDDRRDQANRLRKSYSTYDHGTAYEPQTSTYERGKYQLCPPVAITKSSLPENVANTMQSTPYVPFSHILYKNMNNNSASGSHECNSIIISSHHKITDSLRDHSFRFSYSYYGSIPNLNKSRAPLNNSTEPPSYESLYTKISVTTDRPATDALSPSFEVSKADAIAALNNEVIEKRSCKNNLKDSLEIECPVHLSSQLDLGLGRLLPPTAANAGNESPEQLANNSDNIVFSSHDNDNEQRAEEIMYFRKTRSASNRSKQTEEYNTINNNNKKENDDDILGERLPNSSQLIAMTQAIATRFEDNTDKSTKEMERVKTISHKGEEVNQPVFYTYSIKNSLPDSRLRTAIVNNQNSNSNNYDIRLNTESMDDGCTNNERRMNADRANGSANLFAASWNDKATTAERVNCAHLKSDHNEFHAIPPVPDGQAITQFALGSSYRRLIARRSRLPSYSLLWKKTLRGVRTKVKRVTRSSSGNISPLDALTPNKCLAELERLYAEFRASESALAARHTDAGEGCKSVQSSQHCLSRSQSDASSEGSDLNNGHDCELLNVNTIATADIVDTPNNMRFSIPAATNALFCSSTSELQVQQANIFKVLPTSNTSSIFLSSSECATTGCLTSDDRPRSSSFSSDDRYSNLLHETKHVNNSSNCFDSVENEEIQNDVVIVGAIENDKRNNNSVRITELDKSAVSTQPSLTIQVNSESSDKNNNSNCATNKNYTHIHSSTNNCINNNIVNVDTASVNVMVGVLQKSPVKDNRISVVNCNYYSVYPVNNESACEKSATSLNKVCSVSEVSGLPNIICKVENRVDNNNILSISSGQRDCYGNEMKIVNASDSINIISISAQSQSEQTNGQHSNKSMPIPLAISGSPILLPSQVSGVSRQTTCMSPNASEQSRSFTSTECQTDEIISMQMRLDRVPVSPILSRVQRRRDRRVRRHLNQQLSTSYPQPHPHQFHISGHQRRPQDRHSIPPGSAPIPGITTSHLQYGVHHTLGSSSTRMPAAMSALLRPMLPNLLHRHFPPPYSALPLNRCATTPLPPPTIVGPVPPPPGTTLLPPVISTVPMPGSSPPMVSDGRFTLPLPIIRRSPSERSGKGCCGQWFPGPPLRSLIAVVALGGIACALSGAALGATSLAGPPSSHLTAALLMIGVGVVLVTVSGVAWRMTAPGGPPCLGLGSAVDFVRCGRRPCGRGGGTAHGLLYPEFQHRPPPPSYQASMQEYRLRAPLTTTIRSAGPTSSIAGTSEFSFPSSYRSRNATPATICSERSIDTSTSDRSLSSVDIPEPTTTQQLDSNRCNSTHLTLSEPSRSACGVSQNTEQPTHSQTRQLWTSAIVEIETSNSHDGQNYNKHFQEANKVENAKAASSKAQKEQITIITISKSDGCSQSDSYSRDHIEILAHL
ncbi:uncharacterized protein [Bactrocera oleae]|uniref:uncharacterized protein isoform X2 n=1 Tax=Bactrocera oleae TaxID=104688 RepID=UPI00387E6E35